MVFDTTLYDRLGIQPDASQADIKKAYRKKAVQTHPDKNKDNPKAAEEFQNIGEAYEILSNPEKRSRYDQGGISYANNEAPPPGAGGGFEGFQGASGGFPAGSGFPGAGGGFHFTSSGRPGGGINAENIFAEFFKNEGMGMNMDDETFAGFGGGARSTFSTDRGPRFRPPKRTATPEVTAKEKDIALTLEEMFHGTSRRLKISRIVYDPTTGKRKTEERPLTVTVAPGMKAGGKIKYKGYGNDTEDGGTQDLHFVVKQKPHERFVRDGDDLRTVVELDLKEALTGWQRIVQTIDGKQIRVTAGTPTQPAQRIPYPGQGMPKRAKQALTGERGDLIVEVKVKFPTSLTQQQKQELAKVL